MSFFTHFQSVILFPSDFITHVYRYIHIQTEICIALEDKR